MAIWAEPGAELQSRFLVVVVVVVAPMPLVRPGFRGALAAMEAMVFRQISPELRRRFHLAVVAVLNWAHLADWAEPERAMAAAGHSQAQPRVDLDVAAAAADLMLLAVPDLGVGL